MESVELKNITLRADLYWRLITPFVCDPLGVYKKLNLDTFVALRQNLSYKVKG